MSSLRRKVRPRLPQYRIAHLLSLEASELSGNLLGLANSSGAWAHRLEPGEEVKSRGTLLREVSPPVGAPPFPETIVSCAKHAIPDLEDGFDLCLGCQAESADLEQGRDCGRDHVLYVNPDGRACDELRTFFDGLNLEYSLIRTVRDLSPPPIDKVEGNPLPDERPSTAAGVRAAEHEQISFIADTCRVDYGRARFCYLRCEGRVIEACNMASGWPPLFLSPSTPLPPAKQVSE